ncbi:MAG: polyprenyl synthetase family protein [Spirochaetales bacterium]|nr:polyprenyl synthetase family protein [Spirochaetales bacterium]
MKLDEIYRPIQADLDRVNRLLKLEMEQVVGSVRESVSAEASEGASTATKYDVFTTKAINYLLKKPGKNLRPALVVFSARSLGATVSESLIQLAAAVELIHSSSLVHDDIIDEAEERRALLSVHKKYGIKIAILIGDVLFSQAFAIISNLPSVGDDTKVRLYKILTELTRRMCYGEIFEQRILEGGEQVGRQSYLRILEFKTALLMSTACRCGAIIAGVEADQEEAVASYGLNFGYAYQLLDDFRDGDALFSGDLDFKSLAGEYIRAALSDLGNLPSSTYVDSMSNFAGFILSAV